jgi:hypothetical protein
MSDVLIYETSDPLFADRAIEALQAVGISCYRTGRGARELNATIGRWTDDQVYIYIRQESDARQANEILIGLGAAVDKPFRLPSLWILVLVAAILVVIAVLSAKV